MLEDITQSLSTVVVCLRDKWRRLSGWLRKMCTYYYIFHHKQHLIVMC